MRFQRLIIRGMEKTGFLLFSQAILNNNIMLFIMERDFWTLQS